MCIRTINIWQHTHLDMARSFLEKMDLLGKQGLGSFFLLKNSKRLLLQCHVGNGYTFEMMSAPYVVCVDFLSDTAREANALAVRQAWVQVLVLSLTSGGQFLTPLTVGRKF